ncbi:uncharacterized protein EDB93DRAFT_1080323, partial [Suillus bovinus]|uniref:uncharacterized protein n=1 Tax=Suillus bovinus TaxID=48563 RepID=UPI001B885F82
LISLASHLPKHHISMLMWLCTKHISFNQHHHHISKSPSPNCLHCENTAETVLHYLLIYPQYARACHVLTSTLRCCASSIPYLLSNPKASAPLIHFVNSTGRLRSTFSDVSPQTRNNS